MTAGTITPYRPDERAGRDGFAQLLRAEWTKFRTVRGWLIGMVVAALLTVGVGLLGHSSCAVVHPGGSVTPSACPAPPTGPGGEAVTDSFYFVHQPLAGNGSITVRRAAAPAARRVNVNSCAAPGRSRRRRRQLAALGCRQVVTRAGTNSPDEHGMPG